MADDKPLHVRVAEALGCETVYDDEMWFCDCIQRAHHTTDGLTPALRIARYDTDWSATGPLIEKYGVYLYPHDGAGPWVAQPNLADSETMSEHHFSGATPLIAVCHLILALKDAGKLDA